jgi:hypothetical protein
MGKHGKQETCGVCKGSGKIETIVDNKKETRSRWGCGGTGKV